MRRALGLRLLYFGLSRSAARGGGLQLIHAAPRHALDFIEALQVFFAVPGEHLLFHLLALGVGAHHVEIGRVVAVRLADGNLQAVGGALGVFDEGHALLGPGGGVVPRFAVVIALECGERVPLEGAQDVVISTCVHRVVAIADAKAGAVHPVRGMLAVVPLPEFFLVFSAATFSQMATSAWVGFIPKISLFDAGEPFRIVDGGADVMLAPDGHLLRLDAALRVNRQHGLIAREVGRRNLRNQVHEPEPLFRRGGGGGAQVFVDEFGESGVVQVLRTRARDEQSARDVLHPGEGLVVARGEVEFRDVDDFRIRHGDARP